MGGIVMSINEKDIESLVKAVLEELSGSTVKSFAGSKSNIAKAAVLTGLKKIEVKEFPIPQIKDDEILVKVEGCGVCGTDVHEWKGDPFGLIPVVLGHEGTGEIIALGKNVTQDTVGNPVKVGDKIVTSVSVCGKCNMCLHHPDKPNLCENQGVYGLIPDSEEYHLNGWFATHLVIRKGSTFYKVSDMSLEQRMLIELAAVAVHAVERAKTTGILNFNSKALVQGCGPVGQMVIAVLKTLGVRHIIAIDGDNQRLAMTRKLGALDTINFKEINTLDDRIAFVKDKTAGLGVDFAFQCTGVPAASSEIWKYIRRGGGLCEVGFFVDNGDSKINPHYDICNKEITVVGSWVYSPKEYPVTIAFMKRAKEIGLPLEELITHRYGLYELNEAMETNIALKGIKVAYVNKEI